MISTGTIQLIAAGVSGILLALIIREYIKMKRKKKMKEQESAKN